MDCEFLELVPMDPPPGFPRNGSDNTEGYHGNGIVASLPMQDPVVIRLDELADWIRRADGQRRIGNRMAIAATFIPAGSALSPARCIWRTAPTAPAARSRCGTLLDALDAYAGSGPVVIGGDLNTHVGPGGHDDASEPLFALAASRGYDWTACNLAQPTTRTSTWSNQRRHASARLVLHARRQGARSGGRAGARRGRHRAERPRADPADARRRLNAKEKKTPVPRV